MNIAYVLVIFAVLFISIFLVFRYFKKKTKIILLSILISITVYFTIFTIDANRISRLEKPIFTISSEMQEHKDYTKQIYKGLGYKIEIEMIENQQIIKATMYMFGKTIAGAIN